MSKNLKTERLVFRPLTRDDTLVVHEIRSDPKAMEFWDWPPDETLAQAEEHVARLVDEMTSGSALHWIAETTDGVFAGIFDLSDLRESPEIGFMVPRALWGLGYGLEAAGAVVDEAKRIGLRRLSARVHQGNDRSVRLLTALSFAEGRARQVEVRPGIHVACRFFQRTLG